MPFSPLLLSVYIADTLVNPHWAMTRTLGILFLMVRAADEVGAESVAGVANAAGLVSLTVR